MWCILRWTSCSVKLSCFTKCKIARVILWGIFTLRYLYFVTVRIDTPVQQPQYRELCGLSFSGSVPQSPRRCQQWVACTALKNFTNFTVDIVKYMRRGDASSSWSGRHHLLLVGCSDHAKSAVNKEESWKYYGACDAEVLSMLKSCLLKKSNEIPIYWCSQYILLHLSSIVRICRMYSTVLCSQVLALLRAIYEMKCRRSLLICLVKMNY